MLFIHNNYHNDYYSMYFWLYVTVTIYGDHKFDTDSKLKTFVIVYKL